MPVDLRCPECSAKLRLDERPAANDEIECPKCGTTFFASEGYQAAAKTKAKSKPAPAPEKKKEEKAKPGSSPVKAREGKEREFMNPYLLLAILLICVGAYVGSAYAVLNLLGKSGRVVDMLGYIPQECGIVRGANLKTLSRYPGYKTELERHVPPQVRRALDALAAVNGTEENSFDDYIIYGTTKFGAPGIYVLRCTEDLDKGMIQEGLKATTEGSYLKCPGNAPGILANAYVNMPSNRHVIISTSQQLMNNSQSIAGNIDASVAGDLGDTGEMVVRGHSWVFIRAVGPLSDYIANTGASVDKDLSAFDTRAKSSVKMGMWNSFGKNIRFSGGIECASSDDASQLAKAIRSGPMGQGDDGDVPRQLKSAFSSAGSKEFRNFMANLKFSSKGNCAYYYSSIGEENALKMLGHFDVSKVGGGRGY